MVSLGPEATRSEDRLTLSWLTTLASLVVPDSGPTRLRVSEFPSFDEQLAQIQRRHSMPKPWAVPSINDAMGVPAIFGAVSLIANTVGSLSLEGFREGTLLTDRSQIPRLIVRPNPFSTPRNFFRDTAYYLATRGEAWWWIAARDVDDAPLSLYPIPPWEVTVAQNDFNRLKPTITWGNKKMNNDDVRHITYLPAHDGLRGVGPMQLCGAAVSVTVESQEWAANFFSGSVPSVIGTTEQDMSEGELREMDKQWLEKAPNMPRWLTNGLELTESPFDAQKAQLTESRQHQVGEAARMFSLPGALIEYQMGGSSLTYQNQADVWNDFQRRCLSPHYLEPIEQEISDLLTRATVARFNTKQLLRADPKTRMEVHTAAIAAGIYDATAAAQEEGYAPGNVDYAPVPLAPPQAVPTLLPINRTAMEVRCQHQFRGKVCNYRFAEAASPPYRFTCPRCKAVTANNEQPIMRTAEPTTVQPLEIHVHEGNHTVNPPNVTFERGAIQVDAPDLSRIGESFVEVADHAPQPMSIEMKHPDIGALAEAVDKLENRPVEVTVDSKEFAGALIDLKAELSRRREIVRDQDGRIVSVK